MTDSNVQPTPDLADIPMKPASDPAAAGALQELEGTDSYDSPAEDVTLPTE
jgi:hypothetical protein